MIFFKNHETMDISQDVIDEIYNNDIVDKIANIIINAIKSKGGLYYIIDKTENWHTKFDNEFEDDLDDNIEEFAYKFVKNNLIRSIHLDLDEELEHVVNNVIEYHMTDLE
jgi:hypothetical protein